MSFQEKEGKINTTSTNCGGHSIIIKQIKAKGTKIHMNSMSVNLPGEVAFSTRSFKNTHCALFWKMKKLKWHVWSAHWNMDCPLYKQTLEFNTAQDEITSFQFHIFHQIPPQSKLPHDTGRLRPHGNYFHSYEVIPLSRFSILQAAPAASFPYLSVKQKMYS